MHPGGISRRSLLKGCCAGFGSLALDGLMGSSSLFAGIPGGPHHVPRAKRVIFLFMHGGPSQVDTFDYKPELQHCNGNKLEGADPKTGFFTTSGKVLASPFKFRQHGESSCFLVRTPIPHPSTIVFL